MNYQLRSYESYRTSELESAAEQMDPKQAISIQILDDGEDEQSSIMAAGNYLEKGILAKSSDENEPSRPKMLNITNADDY